MTNPLRADELREQFAKQHEKWLIGTDDDAEAAQEWCMENLPSLLELLTPPPSLASVVEIDGDLIAEVDAAVDAYRLALKQRREDCGVTNNPSSHRASAMKLASYGHTKNGRNLKKCGEDLKRVMFDNWSTMRDQLQVSVDRAALTISGTGWRPLTKEAIDGLHVSGQPFFATITVGNQITGKYRVECHCLEIREKFNEDDSYYLDVGLYGMDGDESGWSLEDYEYYSPFEHPALPEPTPFDPPLPQPKTGDA